MRKQILSAVMSVMLALGATGLGWAQDADSTPAAPSTPSSVQAPVSQPAPAAPDVNVHVDNSAPAAPAPQINLENTPSTNTEKTVIERHDTTTVDPNANNATPWIIGGGIALVVALLFIAMAASGGSETRTTVTRV